MDFTNINDPAGVTALLEKLRSSQAWNELNGETPPAQPESSGEHIVDAATSSGRSVADLLSSLRGVSDSAVGAPDPSPSRASRAAINPRDFSFQQSLPHLSRLSEDENFIKKIKKLQQDQHDLERRLYEERQEVIAKQEEKVKVMITKSNMLGTQVTEREALKMKDVFEKELLKFDSDRVLPAWDALVTRQQAALEEAAVPAMFESNETATRARQQRVIQVLEGVIGSEGTGL